MNQILKNTIVDAYRTGKMSVEQLASTYGFSVESIRNMINPNKPNTFTASIKSVRVAAPEEIQKIKWSNAGKKAAETRRKNKERKILQSAKEQPKKVQTAIKEIPVETSPVKSEIMNIVKTITDNLYLLVDKLVK